MCITYKNDDDCVNLPMISIHFYIITNPFTRIYVYQQLFNYDDNLWRELNTCNDCLFLLETEDPGEPGINTWTNTLCNIHCQFNLSGKNYKIMLIYIIR